jgi:MFS family permease
MNLHSSADSTRPNYKWMVVGMLWWISFFNYADRQAIFSVFSLLRYEMCLSKVELGLLGSSFAWVYGLGAPFAGMVIDRIRRKTAILGGLHIWSGICVATAFSRTFRHLLFFRAAEGLGETFYYPASMSMISDYHGPRTRSRALGIHQTSVYVGTIAGGFFAGLIGEHFGWGWSFILFGELGIILGLLLDKSLHEPQRGAADKIESPGTDATRLAEFDRSPLTTHHSPLTNPGFWDAWPIIWRTPTVLMLMLAFMCANFVGMVLLSWMPNYLEENFHLSLSMAGLTATLFAQLASMIGSPLGGWLADIWRRRSLGGRMLVQALAMFAGAPFVFLCGQTQSVGWLILALTAWGLFKGLYDANIFASAFDVIRPEIRGTVAGLMNMLGWLGGGASAPLVIGLLAERFGLGLAISSAALVYLAAGILLLIAALVFARRDSARVIS